MNEFIHMNVKHASKIEVKSEEEKTGIKTYEWSRFLGASARDLLEVLLSQDLNPNLGAESPPHYIFSDLFI